MYKTKFSIKKVYKKGQNKTNFNAIKITFQSVVLHKTVVKEVITFSDVDNREFIDLYSWQ